MIRDLDDKGLGQNKVLCSSSGVKLPIVKLPLQAPLCSLRQRDRSPTSCRLLALELHWRGFLLVVSSLLPFSCCLFFVASSLSPHLAHLLAYPVDRPSFCFAGSWIVSLAMSGVESKGAGADSFYLVLFVIARLKLWLILIAYLCHLVSALTNNNDIPKIALRQTFVIEPVILANLMTY